MFLCNSVLRVLTKEELHAMRSSPDCPLVVGSSRGISHALPGQAVGSGSGPGEKEGNDYDDERDGERQREEEDEGKGEGR